MKHSRTVIVGIALATVSLGCGDAPPAAAPAPKRAVAAPKAAPEAAVAMAAAPAHIYVYTPLNKRDPFRSPLDDDRTIGGSPNQNCADPLCQYDLDQLRLIAVVSGDANPIAMVKDPLGRGHIVRRNARMGKQGGKVTQILRSSITITEYWQAPDGKVNPNQATLRLKEDPKVAPPLDLLTGQMFQ